MRLYAKANKAFSCLEFFTTHQWRFISNNPIRLLNEMSAEDRKTFYIDVREIEWKSYFETFILGARRFVLKDDPSTLPLARSNLQRYDYESETIVGDTPLFHSFLDCTPFDCYYV